VKPVKIFIVDDDQDLARSLQILLEIEGYQVEVAFNGEDAVEIFQQQEFDLTFLDVKLPKMSGIECFQAFQESKPAANVIMMTAYSDQLALQLLLEKGALGALHKPLVVEEVLTMLGALEQGVVLVVNDHRNFVRNLVRDFSGAGLSVLAAHSENEALQEQPAEDVDILLLDLDLPVLNGLEVYKKIKSRRRKLPSVIVSRSFSRGAEDADPLGAKAVAERFAKPVEHAELLEYLSSMLLDRRHGTS
jgi:DNA-binding response OmpR family regulator